jgi:hypothetical protein
MATTSRTRKTTSKTATRKGGTSKTSRKGTADKANAAKAAKADGPSKRELAKAADAERTTTILERRDAGDKWGEIAADLNITPGKAQFLYMLNAVEVGDVKPIRHRNEDELVAGIKRAREANDEFSSWGWIAARTGVSEGKIKSLAEQAGMPVKGSNIAVARAEQNGGGKKGDGKTGTQRKTTGAAKTSAASKAAKAKARARKTKAGNPS